MHTELFVFNKHNPGKDELTYWDEDNSELLTELEFNYNSSKFSLKKPKRSEYFSDEFLNELNFFLRETKNFTSNLDDFSSKNFRVQLIKNHHHILSYDFKSKTLNLDSELKREFIPIYTLAFYYSLARENNKSEDECYKVFARLFEVFDKQAVLKLISFLDDDYAADYIYDAGRHLAQFLRKLIKTRKREKIFLELQLLRNRALAGKLPWDLNEFEEVSELYEADLFGGEAVTAYYEAFRNSFNQSFAQKYFSHLIKSLKHIGLKVVAQRGSRVAHEQGPILINSASLNIEEEADLEIKRFKSLVISTFTDIETKVIDFAENNNCFEEFYSKDIKSFLDRESLDINFDIDELLYLLNSSEVAKARLEKTLRSIKSKVKKYFSALLDLMEEKYFSLFNEELGLEKQSFMSLYDQLKSSERAILSFLLNIEEALSESSESKKMSVILVQRASLRSAHFIPRFALGHKLYVETDAESQRHRIDAIPYNFICPDFDLIVDEKESVAPDSFFENASISIVTDAKTGVPDIKWENAEDLAISMAAGLYKAVKAFKNNELFHYQMETTLFGPLLDLFRSLLEYEVSNYASIAEAGAFGQVEEIVESYRSEIKEAASFVLDYYLLEDYIQEQYLAQSALGDKELEFEILKENILSMKDVQADIAKYCLVKRVDRASFDKFITFAQDLKSSSKTYREIANAISEELARLVNSSDARVFAKKYIRYPEATARKEFLSNNKKFKRYIITSDKANNEADYYYDFTVAPSRIDFGKHVVASITTLMGRMLGADDDEALLKGKLYIDQVSRANNSLFRSSSDVGIAKVSENTCRAMQYAKAIAFQGVFQSFGADGDTIRATINTRDNKAIGLHVMEHGTMASTGYCITKEPLFILLCLAMKSDDLLIRLGLDDRDARSQIKSLMQETLDKRKDFLLNADWDAYAYNQLLNSATIQSYLSDSSYPWIPSLKSLVTMFNYLGEKTGDEAIRDEYSSLASSLIEHARVVNETGIIQRIHLMNDAIRRAALLSDKGSIDYADLRFAFNASYKGNVSDERENANQYLIAFLLKQKAFLKNTSLEKVSKLIDHQAKNFSLPKEIRVFDPLVDPDTFMGGSLKAKAELVEQRIIALSQALKRPLDAEVIKASVICYGSDLAQWRVINKRISESTYLLAQREELKASFIALNDELKAELKYLELYHKGFYKEPELAYQGVDVIQLNSDHDALASMLEDLVKLKSIMQVQKPDSLLILIDNPQQAKRPFIDYDKACEWMALGGVIATHMLSSDCFEQWRSEINEEAAWAKLFLNKVLLGASLEASEAEEIEVYFRKLKQYIDLKREFISQKYREARDMNISHKSLKRYKEISDAYARVASYENSSQLDFSDWLILGGRWILNGQDKKNIDYVLNIFDQSNDLPNITKKDAENLELFVHELKELRIPAKKRIITQSGSTKEADLVVTSAADSLEFRASQAKELKSITLRHLEMAAYKKASDLEAKSLEELFKIWDHEVLSFEKAFFEEKLEESSKSFAHLLCVLELTAKQFLDRAKRLNSAKYKKVIDNFVNAKEAFIPYFEEIFGDHRTHGGLFQSLCAELIDSHANDLPKLSEMFTYSFLLFYATAIKDENDVINKLSYFFDQYLNVHEEDYPPYAFHRLCAGDSFGFANDYYLHRELREKMFGLACQAGFRTYKVLHYLVSKKSILKHSSLDYKDALIGDYERGVIPICYQHETICLEERLWDCMKALRNFIRNYHDKHPLPIIIKSEDATCSKLFRYQLEDNVNLAWTVGLANPGKHSWDVNMVFRSPKLRKIMQLEPKTGSTYINISVFAPYLKNEDSVLFVNQIYTSFEPELIEEQNIHYLAPFYQNNTANLHEGYQEGHMGLYELNKEGFVHALVMLRPELPYSGAKTAVLPKPDLIMSAHTHPQYIDGTTVKSKIPETWSYLSMRQMYAKTELPRILEAVELEPLAQLEFYQDEFSSREAVKKALFDRLKSRNFEHIDYWILKASRESGGRGISNQLNIHHDLAQIVDFIYSKTKTDDVVMQEFVPNNAKAFANYDFIEKVKDSFVDTGLVLDNVTPQEQMFFAMRAFQSMSGIKGYLFSVNIGSATVNAGQGAKMFYGEPIRVMPLFFASRIQKLFDEQGDLILKQAIPKHAEQFARENAIELVDNLANFNNAFMLNGLFDYIPYLYILRRDKKGQFNKYKIICEDNSYGGLDYFYSYHGERLVVASATDHNSSLQAVETAIKDSLSRAEEANDNEGIIDIDLAKIEFNSGLGQANLLQRVVEEEVPSEKDIFLEWSLDLGLVAYNYQLSKKLQL